MTMQAKRFPARHRYAALLFVLVASLVTQSMRSAMDLYDIALDGVSAALAVAIYVAVFRRTPEHRLMAVTLALVVAIGLVRDTVPPHHETTWALVFQALTAIYLGTAVTRILLDLFTEPRPGIQNILGAICGYLIAGALFGCLNTIAYVLAPGAFNVDPQVTHLSDNWHGRIALFSYYAYTQLLTIGYADVTPVRAPATTLSLFAAIFGVFYTAVVVSQLVAVAQSGQRNERE
ncbi:MAG: ion channel [Burkholderiales bacterium]